VEVPVDPPSSIRGGEAFSWPVSTVRSARPPPREARTPTTHCSSSAGMSRWNVRPRLSRSRAAAGPERPGRADGLRVQPLRLQGAGHHRLSLGG
jgi:hypothetical protein